MGRVGHSECIATSSSSSPKVPSHAIPFSHMVLTLARQMPWLDLKSSLEFNNSLFLSPASALQQRLFYFLLSGKKRRTQNEEWLISLCHYTMLGSRSNSVVTHDNNSEPALHLWKLIGLKLSSSYCYSNRQPQNTAVNRISSDELITDNMFVSSNFSSLIFISLLWTTVVTPTLTFPFSSLTPASFYQPFWPQLGKTRCHHLTQSAHNSILLAIFIFSKIAK